MKNCQLTGIAISGSNYALSNNWIDFGLKGGWVLDSGSYGTISNNLFDGVAADIDDLLLLEGAGSDASNVLSNVTVTNNVFENCYDCGIEGTGSWNQCTFTGNVFSNTQFCAIGGWYITGYGSPYTFYMTNCTFQNNQLDSGRLFEFTNGKGGLMSALDDASATSSWGNGPVYYGNTFSGDSVGAVTRPAAPGGLTATAGNGQVSLSWKASSGATSYDLLRGTSSGGETLVDSGLTGTSFADTGLSNGTTYYYEVAAVGNSGIVSYNSTEASATPQASSVPPAPTGLSAAAGNAQVALTWTASSGATSYDIYRGTTSGGETLVDSGITGTSFTDTGLTNGTTYYYEVTAVNSSESSKSSEVSATPINQPPAITTPASASPATVTGKTTNLSVQASDPDGDALTYTWAVTSGPSGVSFNANGTGSANNATATFTQAGSYTFQVTVRDTAGLTATSSVTVSVNQTLTSLAVVPSTTALNDGGTQQFTVSAKDQFGNAMTPAVTWSVNGLGTISSSGLYTAPSTGSGSATVTASSGAISGTAAVTVSSSNPPAAPIGLTASPASGQVSLTWTASSGATSYDIYRGTSSGGETLLASGVTGTSFTDSGLTNGTTYYYEVAAVNSGGQSSKSSEVAATAGLTIAQIQALPYSQFKTLTPVQVQYLTVAQIATIPNVTWLGTLSAADRAALSPAQVQALKPAAIDGTLLTPAQFAELTVSQIQGLGFSEFRYLDPAQIPDLTLTQVGSIPNTTWLGTLSAADRAALSTAQVQALKPAAIDGSLLTPAQFAVLTATQIQGLPYSEFRYLAPAQIPDLTLTQIATIPNAAWLGTLSAADRAARARRRCRRSSRPLSMGLCSPPPSLPC